MLIIVPILIMVVFTIIVVALKVHERRVNANRRAQGLPPLKEETPIVNVIDWSRR